MDFRILGPLEARDGERLLPLGGPKRRAVLGLLLLEANRTVPSERLVDALWGDAAPATALASLQNHVSRLRRVLDGRLETRAPGYVLRVEPGELDLDRFRRLVAEAGAAPAEPRAALLREALALWRGRALADLAGEPAAAAAAHLDELRLAALEDRVDADLELGRHAELVPELDALVAEHPYRERLRGQLILALYRSGRQGDALEAYDAFRRMLGAELGAEPGPELRSLHGAILRHEDAAAAPLPVEVAPPPAVPEERKTVTVLLADLAAADVPADTEARRALLGERWAAAEQAVSGHGGTARRLDEGRVQAVFGVPAVHDDDALRAVRAAFALVDERLAARVALTTGEVVTGDFRSGEPLVSGAPLEQAERLRADAADGEIRAAERTWRLVRHAVSAETSGGARILRSVDPDAPSLVRRLETRLVGREDELSEILRPFERAVTDRRPQLVTVFGAPGIGKTRIAGECTVRLPAARVLVARCPAYGRDTTYAPLRRLVAALAGGDPRPWLEEQLAGEPEADTVAHGIVAAVGDGAETAPVEEIAWAVRRLLESLARPQPLLLVVDDAHWAAPVFLDLVESVVALGRGPLLVLCLARPDLLDVRPGWGGGRLSSSTVLLEPLSREAADALLAELAPPRELADEDRARILGLAEGNPLFLEQLLATALEGETAVPDSIHALLAARLDRLDEPERSVAQAAAVCGASFSETAVAGLVGGDVTASLVALADRELLRPIEPGALGETWAFRHVLIRDEAYDSIPKRRRADLHERLARRAAAEGDEADEVVGYHLEQAVRCRRDVGERSMALDALAGEAASRLGAAGGRALDRNDMTASASLLRRAVELAGEHERAALMPTLAEALHYTGDMAGARSVLAEARTAAERGGDEHELARVTLAGHLVELWTDALPPVDQVLAELERVTPLLREASDHEGLSTAELLRFHLLDRGRGADPERRLQLALAEARLAGSRYLEANVLSWISITLPRGSVPVPDASRIVREIVETAPNRFARASALGALGLLRAMEGAFEEARALVEEDRAILLDLGLRHAATAHSISIGEVELIAGDDEAAIRILREGYEQVSAVGDAHSSANVAWRLALALGRVGRDEEAERFARIAAAATPGGFWVDVWWRVVLAGVEARRGRAEEAERLVREAAAPMARIPPTGMQVDAQIEAAGALELAGRAAEAAVYLEDAAAMAERLGYVVAARRARERLSR